MLRGGGISTPRKRQELPDLHLPVLHDGMGSKNCWEEGRCSEAVKDGSSDMATGHEERLCFQPLRGKVLEI